MTMNIIAADAAQKVVDGYCPDCDEEISQSFEGDGMYFCEDCGFEVEANAIVWALPSK